MPQPKYFWVGLILIIGLFFYLKLSFYKKPFSTYSLPSSQGAGTITRTIGLQNFITTSGNQIPAIVNTFVEVGQTIVMSPLGIAT